ncbi:MAG: ABC transporter substrate-binding protein [Myxococcales bacterium]
MSALVAKNTAPYQQALAAFKRAYDGPVVTHVLDFEADAVAAVRAEKPALVLAVGVKAAKAARELGEATPVVYCMVIEPKANGIDADHVVGVPLEIPVETQLEQLKRLAPDLGSIGLVFNPARSANKLGEAVAAAAKLSMTVVGEPASSAAQFPDSLQAVLPKAKALWLLSDPTLLTQDTLRLMLEASMSHRLPLLTFSDEFVRMGALMALAPDYEGAGIEAARLALEIVGGKKPAEVSPARPRWNLIVNLATAKALGLTVPADVLKTAIAVQ